MSIFQKIKYRFISIYKAAKINKRLVKMSEELPCPLCAQTNTQVLAKKERYGLKLNTVICKNDGLIYFSPMPSNEFLEEYYSEHYQTFHRKATTPSMRVTKREEARAHKLINHLDELALKKKMNVLDIGCSAGHILSTLKESWPDRNLTLDGVEPDPNYVNYIDDKVRGVNAYCCMIEDFIPTKKYDLILLMHGLEHIRDMAGLLKKCQQMLNDGGLLYLETPNIFNWKAAPSLQKFFLLSKLYTFSPKTLSAFMEQNGFETLKLDSISDKHILGTFKKGKTSKITNSLGEHANEIFAVVD